jgi:YD repeat-containing protein
MKNKFMIIALGLIMTIGIFEYWRLKNKAAQCDCITNSPQASKIHTFTMHNGPTYTYTYETPIYCGRLLSITTNDNSFSIQFDYAAHKATFKNGTKLFTYTLDSNGFEVSRNDGASYAIDPIFNDPAVAGYCKQAIEDSKTTNYLFVGGNRVRSTTIGSNDYRFVYTSAYNSMENYFGLSTKDTNWLKAILIGTTNDTLFSYTYTYDNYHRVKTQKRNNNNVIDDITYY